MNRIILVGFLGKDAEFRKTNADKTLAHFSVATKTFYTKGNGEKSEETTWHQVKCWGKVAEKCEGLKKGSRVFIEGEYRENRWTDKEGKERREMFVQAAQVYAITNASLTSGARSQGSEYGGEQLTEHPGF